MEEHALVDVRAKGAGTAGLHGQLHPNGLGARVQYEPTSPWSTLPQGKSRRDSQQGCNSQKKRTPVKRSTRNPLSKIVPLMSPFSSASYHDAGEMGTMQEKSTVPTPQKSRQHTAPGQRKASCEWLSIETTSILRHQNVKDLYYYYGIQRPAGLVSSENITFSPERTSQPVMKYRFCHLCSWANPLDTLKCKCGHSFCEGCEYPSTGPTTMSDGSAECIDNVLKREGEPLHEDKIINKSSDYEVSKQAHFKQQMRSPPPKQQSTEEECNHQEISKQHTPRSREQLDKFSVVFPVLRLEEGRLSHGSREMRPRHAELPDSSNVLQQTIITSETSISARGTPLPIAGPLSVTYPSSLVTVGRQMSQPESPNLRSSHNYRFKGCHHRSSHSSSSPNTETGSGCDSCDNSGYHATRQGYQPHRRGITCIRKRRRYPEETDSGYIAGASHLEELELPQQKADPDPRSENEGHGYNRPDTQHSLSRQNEPCSPRGKISTHVYSQFSHQNSCEGHDASLQKNFGSQEDVQYNNEQSYPKDREAHSSSKTTALLSNKPPSNDRPGKEIDHDSSLNASDSSGGCQQCMNEDQNQRYRAGHRQTYSHVHGEHKNTPQQIVPGNAIAGVSCLVSMPICSRPPTKVLSKLTSSYLTAQSVHRVPAPKSHVEMKTPDSLTYDSDVALQKSKEQEVSTTRNNQFRPYVRKISSCMSKQEDPEASPKNFCNTIATVPGVVAEGNYNEHRESSYADPTTNTTPSMSFQPSGDLSPRKFQPASRRLSAFFKLQEQNIVALLNKQLQQHQDDLKRKERMPDEKISTSVQEGSLGPEQLHDADRQENKSKQKFTESNSEENGEHDVSGPSLQLRERSGKAKDLGTDWQGIARDISSEQAHIDMIKEHQKNEHDCAWKRIAMMGMSGISREQNLSGTDASTKQGGKEASDIGISSITIVIHLEGREDVVIKGDLRQEK